MKICKQCDNPVEDYMEICPYCSYQFEKPKAKTKHEKVKKTESGVSTQGQNTSSSSGTAGNVRQGTGNQPRSGGTSTASTPVFRTRKKGKVGKVLIVALLVFAGIKLYNAWSAGDIDLAGLLNRDEEYASQSSETSRYEESTAQSTVESSTENTMESTQESSEEYAEANPAYILPDSDSRYYSREDLVGLSKEELRIARNEIYARHGRRFNDKNLQAYFDAQDWYSGDVAPGDFSDSVFNEYEAYNKDLIVAYEKELQ